MEVRDTVQEGVIKTISKKKKRKKAKWLSEEALQIAEKRKEMPKNAQTTTHLQNNAQNSPGAASTVCELRTSRCSGFRKGRGSRDQIANIC